MLLRSDSYITHSLTHSLLHLTTAGAPPHSTTFIPEPGNYCFSSGLSFITGIPAEAWAPDAVRESWGSGAGPMFLHEGQLVCLFLQPNPSLNLQEHLSRGPLTPAGE